MCQLSPFGSSGHRSPGARRSDVDECLREIIEKPAQLVGLELQPGLIELLLQEMESQTGALPLLQHALRELWK
jgi:hypothetical protein